MFGYCGKILWVDLESKRSVEKPLDKKDAEQLIGGAGLAVKIHYALRSFELDAFSPKNPLVIMTGPLTATPTPGTSRVAFCA
ncbi:MAG: aldehyde ferredoxin oxidoreductase N-terminal domain-containing protein, partial [Archaeoglobaceae archaeon]